MSADEAAQVQLCRALMARKSKSFRLASLLLPRAIREATFILYAWCRRCDDALDERDASGAEPASEVVLRLERELDAVYAGAPQHEPILIAFQRVVMQHRIPAQYPRELLAGMQMDARGTRYETRAELLLYCYRVASTVGLMMCHVMGVRDPAALRRAAHLGVAMQLTNICRDVGEDLTLGRLYLPAQLLAGPSSVAQIGRADHYASAGVQNALHAELALPKTRRELEALRPSIIRATRTLLGDAQAYYRSADRGIPALGLRCAFAVRTARLLYAAIGARLAQQGYDPLRGRAVTPWHWKFALVLAALGATLLELPRRAFARARLRIPAEAVEAHDVVSL